MAVAPFIDHWASAVRDGQAEPLLGWLGKNESRLADLFPVGSRWLGLYGEVIAGDSSGNLWHMFMGLDSYGALDVVSAAARDRASEFGQLIDELFSFFDQSSGAPGGRWLYRAAPNIVVWENE